MDINKAMNLHHFQQLMQIFQEADEDGSGSLDLNEFREAFGSILGSNLSYDQMTMLFMKIDANSDGGVDWDEFCTYMVLEKQAEFDMITEDTSNIFLPCKRGNRSQTNRTHKDMIKKIFYLPKEKKYISGSREGTICIWTQSLKLHTMVDTKKHIPASSWVTDVVLLPNLNKLAVASDDRQITLFDSLNMKQQNLLQIKPLDFTPLCMAVVSQCTRNDAHVHAGQLQDTIVFGDDAGMVNLLTLTEMDFHDTKNDDLLLHPSMLCKKIVKRKAHDGWVAKVRYYPDMSAFLSCCCSNRNSLVISDVERKSQRSIHIHKGVQAFEYSRRPNFIITGGVDKIIRLWNPYILSKPAAVLKGHNTGICEIVINELDGQVISLSIDKTIKVWELRSQKLLQTITDKFAHRPENTISAMYLDMYHHRLLTCSSGLDVWPMRNNRTQQLLVRSHPRPMCTALYNSNFHQVVSGCEGGCVKVWDVKTGEKLFQFTRVHDQIEITAMTFDQSGRRLITGARDGTIKIWNFNNGACLKNLVKNDDLEVTDLKFFDTPTNKYIVAVGWNRKIAVFLEDDDNESFDLHILKKIPADSSLDSLKRKSTFSFANFNINANPDPVIRRGHNDDITSIDFLSPNLLATAACDGEVILWNLESGHHVNHLLIPNMDKLSLEERDVEVVMFIGWYRNYKDNSSTVSTPKSDSTTKKSRQQSRKGSMLTSGLESSNTKDRKSNRATEKKRSIISSESEPNKVFEVTLRRVSKCIDANSGMSDEQHDCLDSVAANLQLKPESQATSQNCEPILVAGSGDGGIRFWAARDGNLIHEAFTTPVRDIRGAILSMCIHIFPDDNGMLMMVGDSQGILTRFNLSTFNYTPTSNYDAMVVQTHQWRAHVAEITGLAFVPAHGSGNKCCVLSSSSDCSIRCWNIDGTFIGIFGQEVRWSHQNIEPNALPSDVAYHNHVLSERDAHARCVSRGLKRQAEKREKELGRHMTDLWKHYDSFDSPDDKHIDQVVRRCATKWKAYKRADRDINQMLSDMLASSQFDPNQQKRYFCEHSKKKPKKTTGSVINTSMLRYDNVFHMVPVYGLGTMEMPTAPSLKPLSRHDDSDVPLSVALLRDRQKELDYNGNAGSPQKEEHATNNNITLPAIPTKNRQVVGMKAK